MFLRKSSLYLLLFSLLAAIIAPPFARTYAAPASIVNPVQLYTYDKMTSDIKKLAAAYPDLIHYESIGKTVYGRDIWAVRLGYGEATIFINGSHHAREWLTTNLNMYMIDQYARAYTSGSTIGKYAARQILNETTIWFVPMVNPDGVTLQQFGAAAFPQKVRSTLIKFNQGSTNFARWKANAQGVDLNRQYQAEWEHIQDAVLYPSYMKYKGSAPVQAQEVKAMVAFTKRINPETAVSYHSAGRVIYWNFRTPKANLARDQRLASQFAAITGYSLVKPTSNPSGGGYTDWFIQAFGRPAFTPELGIKRGETNLPVSVFNEEWQRNKTIGLWLADEGYKLWYSKNKNKNIIQDYAAPLSITEKTALYNSNHFLSPAVSYVSPQIVQTVRRSGKWFAIKTSSGEKWMYISNPKIGNPEPVDLYLNMAADFAVYQSPLDIKPVTTYKPQEVHAIKKWMSLYQIDTPSGLKWVNLTLSPVIELTPIQQDLTLNTPFDLYADPEGVKIQEITEVPQQVTAIRKWNNWYQIILSDQQKGWIQLQ